MKIMNSKLRFSPPDSIAKYNEIEKRGAPKLCEIVYDPRNYLKEHAAFCWSILLPTLLVILYAVIKFAFKCYNELFMVPSAIPPLSLVTCYMIVKLFICVIVRFSLEGKDGSKRVRLSFQDSVLSVAPLGFATAFGFWFSTKALQMITLPLFKMINSTTIVFVLVLAIVLKVEKKSWLLAGTVALIFGGAVASNYEPTEIHVLGFVLALVGSFAGSFSLTLPQQLMQHSKHGLSSPIDLMYYMQPWTMLFFIPVVLSFEGVQIYNQFTGSDWPLASVVFVHFALIIVGGILAFCLKLTALLIISRTSSLTLCVAEVLEWLLIPIVFQQSFEDKSKLSNASFMGTQTCFAGIVIYGILRMWTTGDEKTEEINTVSKSVDDKKEAIPDGIKISFVG